MIKMDLCTQILVEYAFIQSAKCFHRSYTCVIVGIGKLFVIYVRFDYMKTNLVNTVVMSRTRGLLNVVQGHYCISIVIFCTIQR